MKRSVPTRWNTVAEASGCALELKKALVVLWDMPQHNHRTAKLCKYKLSDTEWGILKQLYDILEVSFIIFSIQPAYVLMCCSQHFLAATLRISKSHIPLMHEVIPVMDILTNELNATIQDTTIHIAVRAAAARGRVIMDKYYSRTDESIMYHMAMSK